MSWNSPARRREQAAAFRAMLTRQRETLEASLQRRGCSGEQAAAFLRQKRGGAPWWATEERLESWLDTELQRWIKEEA